jgi:hypothetical protein
MDEAGWAYLILEDDVILWPSTTGDVWYDGGWWHDKAGYAEHILGS